MITFCALGNEDTAVSKNGMAIVFMELTAEQERLTANKTSLKLLINQREDFPLLPEVLGFRSELGRKDVCQDPPNPYLFTTKPR